MKVDWNNEELRIVRETDDEAVFLDALARRLEGFVVSFGKVVDDTTPPWEETDE